MNQNDLIYKKLEHELSLYKMMVNASLDSITLIDRDYTYQIVTYAYIKARQLKKEEILNHSVADVWGKQIFEEIIKEKLDECFTGKTVSHIAAYEFKKDEINYIETIYTPCFTSGSIFGLESTGFERPSAVIRCVLKVPHPLSDHGVDKTPDISSSITVMLSSL